MAFASYTHTKALSVTVADTERDQEVNDTDAVASRLMDHAFQVGGLQEVRLESTYMLVR